MSEDFNDQGNNNEESFADLLESYGDPRGEDIQVGDRIKGEIIAIGKDTVFVDTGTKIDGIVEKEELLDETGELPFREGDTLELYVVSRRSNEIKLSRALSGVGGLHLLEEAYENGVPVEAKVKNQIKGGFQVEIMHRRAFCPISQMDFRYADNPDEYIGNTYSFLITEFEENGRNIVLSRRQLLQREQEKERKKFLEDITIGSQLEGRVTKLMPYGAFVELFPGLEGMVHISELSWARPDKPDDLLRAEDAVTVKVIGLEQDEQSGQTKIALSIKQVTGDPWQSVPERFHEGDRVEGKVRRCANFGAFVEITPGVEGLVHISEMSFTKRILRPEEVVQIGEVVSVLIKEIDIEKRRISLSLRDAAGDPWLEVKEKYRAGQAIDGTVEKKEKFGLFVSLEPGVTGLLPQSKIKNANRPALIEKLRQGDKIAVIIEEINPDHRKITLAPGDSMNEADWRRFAKDKGSSFGSLGEKLHQALEAKKEEDLSS
jgi:small subunit ribosomal protein S1